MQDNYFDSALAGQIADSLRRRLADGEYDILITPKSLAEKLTGELFDLTRDKHLVVSVKATTESQTGSAHANDVDRTKRGQMENFGVQRVEILNGNVGYLNLISFYRPEEAGSAIAAAMHLVRHADALIVDLRDHSGGSPDTTVLFASYFFEKPALPLFRIIDRAGGVRLYATSTNGLADRNQSRRTYLLTSERTFSAGEGIAYLLQEQGRAQVIGESTAGAANPGRAYDVNRYFEITVPNGKILSAIKGSNWEGSGVKPDIAIASNDALRAAHARALSDLIQQTTDTARRVILEELRDNLISAGAAPQSKNEEDSRK